MDIIFFIPTFLNPCFKNLKYLSKTKKEQVHDFIKMKIKELKSKIENEKKESEKKHENENEIEFFSFEEEEEDNQEFFLYCSEAKPKVPAEEFDLIEYWKNNTRYPILKCIAEKYLALQSSSSDVERDNSFLENTITEKRCNLDPEKVSKMFFIKKNLFLTKYYSELSKLHQKN